MTRGSGFGLLLGLALAALCTVSWAGTQDARPGEVKDGDTLAMRGGEWVEFMQCVPGSGVCQKQRCNLFSAWCYKCDDGTYNDCQDNPAFDCNVVEAVVVCGLRQKAAQSNPNPPPCQCGVWQAAGPCDLDSCQ